MSDAYPEEPVDLPGTGDKARDAIERGQHAARLLDDELLLWALREMRRAAHVEFEGAAVADTERLQLSRLRLDVIKQFAATLQTLIAEGEVVARNLENDERLRHADSRDGFGSVSH